MSISRNNGVGPYEFFDAAREGDDNKLLKYLHIGVSSNAINSDKYSEYSYYVTYNNNMIQ